MSARLGRETYRGLAGTVGVTAPDVAAERCPPTATHTIRVVLASCYPLLSRGIARALSRNPTFELVADVDDFRRAVTITDRLVPDVLLVDASACGEDSHVHVETIRARQPAVVVVLLTEPDRETLDRRVVSAVNATILRNIEPQALAAALCRIVAGHDDGAALAEDAAAAAALPLLTRRERQVLKGLSRGLTNRQIARTLWLSEYTIKFHLSRIYRKLGVGTRAEAATVVLHGGNGNSPRYDTAAEPARRTAGDLLPERSSPAPAAVRKTRRVVG
jgi:DNA-binding NarL/FixJ family response regulator